MALRRGQTSPVGASDQRPAARRATVFKSPSGEEYSRDCVSALPPPEDLVPGHPLMRQSCAPMRFDLRATPRYLLARLPPSGVNRFTREGRSGGEAVVRTYVRVWASIAIAAVLGVAVLVDLSPEPEAAGAAEVQWQQVSTGKVEVQGATVRPRIYASPPAPTPEQAKWLDFGDEHEAPSVVTNGRGSPAGGPAVDPGSFGIAATSTLQTSRSTVVPVSTASGIPEPATDQNGRNIMQVGNWFAGYSANNGSTWSWFNPFTIFGGGFCCDQLTAYHPSSNRQFWLLQYSTPFKLIVASAPGNALSGSWSYYTLTPALFGFPSTYQMDYNHMATSTGFLYVSTNLYEGGANRGNLVVRAPIVGLASGATVTWEKAYSQYAFSVAFTQGAGDTMYWGTNRSFDAGFVAGSQFDIWRWSDNSVNSASARLNVTPFVYMSNDGQCGSRSGVVKNWCQGADSRMGGGAYRLPTIAVPGVSDRLPIIQFVFPARQDASHPWPYSRHLFFSDAADAITYQGYTDHWSNEVAMIYEDIAPDARGHLGVVFAWGGGTGTNNYYPGVGYAVDDDLSLPNVFDTSFAVNGSGNACINSNVDLKYRWGDYLTVKPMYPARSVWVASGFYMASNCTQYSNTINSSVRVVNQVFGRTRDQWGGYTRWIAA